MAGLKPSPNSFVMALMSVLLISVAQLSMKWGMASLNQLWPDLLTLWHGEQASQLLSVSAGPLLAVAAGLACYGLSMVCWVIALKQLPLSIAYPLLSLSYVLVYIGAVCLPWLDEAFTWMKGIGILLILIGLIFVMPGQQTSHESDKD